MENKDATEKMDFIGREKALQFRLTVNVSRDANSVTVARGVADAIAEYIKAIPAADVRPVPKGEWIETGYFDNDYQPIYECSHCHGEVADSFMAKHLFCLHCGADMRPEGGADG